MPQTPMSAMLTKEAAMNKIYESPVIELIIVTVDVITASVQVPPIGEDDNELPKQDW